MMCYRDQSFCTAYGKICGNSTCPRAFTESEKSQTQHRRGQEEPPIAWYDFYSECEEALEIPPTAQSIPALESKLCVQALLPTWCMIFGRKGLAENVEKELAQPLGWFDWQETLAWMLQYIDDWALYIHNKTFTINTKTNPISFEFLPVTPETPDA